MLSKFEISLKEGSKTEGWLQLLYNTNVIDELIFKNTEIFADVSEECLLQVVRR